MNYGQLSPETDAVEGGNFFSQLPGILWQRRWFVIIPLVLGIVAAAALALLLPPSYRASATMLVQSPQLPAEVTGEATNEVIDRRIARIRQQITSRPDLVALIEENGLYRDERGSTPLSEIIEGMREAIVLTPTEAQLSASNAQDRTIAFELSYSYPEAAPAQAVVQRLMERILELDASTSSEQATNTVQFLTDQSNDLQKRIREVEGQIAGINARYGGVLSRSNVPMMGGGGGSYDVQIGALQRENSALVSQRETARKSAPRDPVVVGAETQLAAARATYTESHPDVVAAKQRLEEARRLAKQNVEKLPVETIDQQIAFNNSQIAQLRAAKAQEMGQVAASLSSQAQAPLVQQQIAQLQNRLETLNEQHQGVAGRLLAARAGARAEDQQMGERLLVVDPPVVPDSPASPNRLLIAGLGVAGGLALGLALAFAVELFLRPIRDPATIAGIAGAKPLVVVPLIQPRVAKNAGRRWWRPFRSAPAAATS